MPDRERFTMLGDLKIIYKSKAFRAFLIERQRYLQKQVNMYIRQQQYTEAYGELAKYDDLNKLMKRLDEEIKKLEKE